MLVIFRSEFLAKEVVLELWGRTIVLSKAKRNVVEIIEAYAIAHCTRLAIFPVLIVSEAVPSIHESDEEMPLWERHSRWSRCS